MLIKLNQFWSELKRRKVIHVIIVYATAALVIIELVNNITEPLNLPAWTPSLIIIILIVGFPLAIIFSWIYDITLKGITKTERAISFDTLSRVSNSIAVLPFRDMSPEKDQEYFCDGITEEIINALAHVASLKVISQTSCFAFKDKQVDIREIGKQLNVESLVEGSIRKSGNRIRITAQLIRVSDGIHIWSEKYDREIQDVFAIQDEISLAIVETLKVKLLGNERSAIIKKHTEDLEAYNLYLKGNYYNQMLTSGGIQKAIEYYEQSLQLDPEYSLAYIGLASVYWYSSYWGDMKPNEAYPKAIEYVNEAQLKDSSSAEVHCLWGIINMNYFWNWEKSEEEFTKAIQLNPNSALIHIYYSLLLTGRKRHKEAAIEADKARELDPLSSYVNSIAAHAYNFAERFETAIEMCKVTLDLNQNYFLAHYVMGIAYLANNMFKEALNEYKKAVELSGRTPLSVASLASMYYAIGDNLKADECFSELKERSADEYIPPLCFYMIHRTKGELDLAYHWVEKALSEHDSWLLVFYSHPKKEIRIPDNSRFSGLLRKMGFE